MDITCKILVEYPTEGVFRSEQPVRGVLNYFVEKATEYEDITLSLIGQTKCSFKALVFTDSRQYNGSEEFLSTHIDVVPKIDGKAIIPAGAHAFPFEFVLPEDIPSSYKYESKKISDDDFHKCEVTYTISFKATKSRKLKLSEVFNEEIVVYGDLKPTTETGTAIYQLERELFKPQSDKNNVIKLRVEIANSFLRPGENVKLKLDVTNDSGRLINAVKFVLRRRLTLISGEGKKRTFDKDIRHCSGKSKEIAAKKKTITWHTIPTLAELYSIQYSKCVSLEFILKVTVCLSMPHITPNLEIPIVIGQGAYDTLKEIVDIDNLDIEESPPSYDKSCFYV